MRWYRAERAWSVLISDVPVDRHRPPTARRASEADGRGCPHRPFSSSAPPSLRAAGWGRYLRRTPGHRAQRHLRGGCHHSVPCGSSGHLGSDSHTLSPPPHCRTEQVTGPACHGVLSTYGASMSRGQRVTGSSHGASPAPSTSGASGQAVLRAPSCPPSGLR